MPRIQAVSVPLEYEEVGEIVVVGLRNTSPASWIASRSRSSYCN